MATPAAPPKSPPPATNGPPSPPSKAPAPPPPKGGAGTTRTARREFTESSGVEARPQKVVIYGPGGVGKSELASLIKQVGVEPKVLDIGDGTSHLNVRRVSGLTTWDDLRDALHSDSLWQGIGAVVIDDLTKAQELAEAWTIANVKHEKGHHVNSIEGYGFGKGLTHLYESFLPILSDLDAHVRAGRWVICIAHECTANAPNPGGEDFIRYEPRLQSPASGKSSIRHRVKEWADHLLFVGYDVFVEDGKGTGSGTRTIHTTELPMWWAKSRTLSEDIPYERGSAALWQQLLKTGGQ